jgi:hypothetical protein
MFPTSEPQNGFDEHGAMGRNVPLDLTESGVATVPRASNLRGDQMNDMAYKQKSTVEKRMKSGVRKLRRLKDNRVPIWEAMIWILIQKWKLLVQKLNKRMKRRALEIGAHP